MTQKVLQIGSSAGVTLPKILLEELGLKIGDQVQVKIDKNRKTVVIEPNIQIDRELLDWTEKFIEQYRPALKALAKK